VGFYAVEALRFWGLGRRPFDDSLLFFSDTSTIHAKRHADHVLRLLWVRVL